MSEGKDVFLAHVARTPVQGGTWPLTPISLGITVVAGMATLLGLVSIAWVRAPVAPHRLRHGGVLFLAIAALIGLAAACAIWQQPKYILPFCLILGGLLIVMLWGEDHPLDDKQATLLPVTKS